MESFRRRDDRGEKQAKIAPLSQNPPLSTVIFFSRRGTRRANIPSSVANKIVTFAYGSSLKPICTSNKPRMSTHSIFYKGIHRRERRLIVVVTDPDGSQMVTGEQRNHDCLSRRPQQGSVAREIERHSNFNLWDSLPRKHGAYLSWTKRSFADERFRTN